MPFANFDISKTITAKWRMAFRRRADDGTTVDAGLVALLFFRGSGQILLRSHGAL